jgi:hypothetical protein
MKLIRLQSGPLACVYQEEEGTEPSGLDSGVYRAFSGSVEGAGASESEALVALDRNLRRLSEPPASSIENHDPAFDTSRCGERYDTDHCECPPESRPSFNRSTAPDTVPAPRLSSLRALAFNTVR